MAVYMSDKIADILKECQHTPGLESFTSKPNEVTVEEDHLFLDGISSYIVRLRASDGSTVVAKHAPPYVREYPELMPLSDTRAELEMLGLQLFERYIPGSAAKPFFFSSKHRTTLMEDLVGFKILHSELLAGNVSKAAIGSVAVYFSTLHRSTHKDNISKQEWSNLEEMLTKFQPMREQAVQFMTACAYFKNPHDEVTKQLKDKTDSRIFGNSQVNKFVEQFMEDFIHGNECLVHADCYTQNLLVKGDEIKLTDLEIMGLGKCSMEVSKLFADLVFVYYFHLVSPDDAGRHKQTADKIKDCSYHLVNTYTEHMSWSVGDKVQHVSQLMKEIAGYTGRWIFLGIGMGVRSYLGAHQVELLEAAVRLMEQYHVVDGVDAIYSILALQ